jgi:antitoxin component of MazEF toxin-antitoxin module
MKTKERRTVMKTGDSLSVSLPAYWVRYKGVRAGDMLTIICDDQLIIMKGIQ